MANTHLFEGRVTKSGNVLVTYNGKPLPVCAEHYNASPDGFMWGYDDSGVSQLAYAIMHKFGTIGNVVNPVLFAEETYLAFRRKIISKIPTNLSWVMSLESVAEWGKNGVLSISDSQPVQVVVTPQIT